MMRVVLPWMIGRAFEKLSEPSFMSMLADEVQGGKFLPASIKASLGSGVQGALKRLFPKYNLTGKTWAEATPLARVFSSSSTLGMSPSR